MVQVAIKQSFLSLLLCRCTSLGMCDSDRTPVEERSTPEHPPSNESDPEAERPLLLQRVTNEDLEAAAMASSSSASCSAPPEVLDCKVDRLEQNERQSPCPSESEIVRGGRVTPIHLDVVSDDDDCPEKARSVTDQSGPHVAPTSPIKAEARQRHVVGNQSEQTICHHDDEMERQGQAIGGAISLNATFDMLDGPPPRKNDQRIQPSDQDPSNAEPCQPLAISTMNDERRNRKQDLGVSLPQVAVNESASCASRTLDEFANGRTPTSEAASIPVQEESCEKPPAASPLIEDTATMDIADENPGGISCVLDSSASRSPGDEKLAPTTFDSAAPTIVETPKPDALQPSRSTFGSDTSLVDQTSIIACHVPGPARSPRQLGQSRIPAGCPSSIAPPNGGSLPHASTLAQRKKSKVDDIGDHLYELIALAKLPFCRVTKTFIFPTLTSSAQNVTYEARMIPHTLTAERPVVHERRTSENGRSGARRRTESGKSETSSHVLLPERMPSELAASRRTKNVIMDENRFFEDSNFTSADLDGVFLCRTCGSEVKTRFDRLLRHLLRLSCLYRRLETYVSERHPSHANVFNKAFFAAAVDVYFRRKFKFAKNLDAWICQRCGTQICGKQAGSFFRHLGACIGGLAVVRDLESIIQTTALSIPQVGSNA
jgi:hypothetical protein